MTYLEETTAQLETAKKQLDALPESKRFCTKKQMLMNQVSELQTVVSILSDR